jgi:predicted transposase/invertase (TIGR01784 family)
MVEEFFEKFPKKTRQNPIPAQYRGMKPLLPFSSSHRENSRRAGENAKPLSPTLDIVFKTLFSGKDEDSREALKSLLSDCIHRPVRDLRLQDTEILPAFFKGKVFRLDVHVTFNDGEQADIEMQVKRSNDDIKARSVLYSSRLLESQLGRGELYQDAKRVYVIFFLDFILFPHSKKVPRRYVFMEETEHDRLNELMEVVYYEMPKTADVVREYFEGKETLKNLPAEQKWCIYFKYRAHEGMEPLIEKLCREEEGIMRADRALKKKDREWQKWARWYAHDNARLEYNSMMYDAEERGRMAGQEKGIALGEDRGRLASQEEIARNMKARGYSSEEIRAITGLSQ